MRRPTVRRLRRFAPCSLLLPIELALAQTALPAEPVVLEQITVTAEKRSVDLQKAPLAVTAIPGATLDKSNIYDLAGLNGQVPGLSIAKSSGFERIVTIRGVGSETPLNAYTTQPGVSLHIDGVYIANSISLDQSLFDLDRIEILRGPQGTLFGQSSTGGTINLVTRQPLLGEFSGSGDLSVGNHRLARARAELNVPVGSQWALRGSVQKYRHDGFARLNTQPDYRLDDADDHGLKLAALWQPNAGFSATLTGQWYRASPHGAAQKNVLDPDPDPRSVSQDYPPKLSLNADLVHARLEWTLPWATFRSITAHQKLRHRQQQDSDRSTDALLRRPDGSAPYTYDAIAAWTTRLENTTQEFNLASRPGGRIDWIVGAFAMKQRSNQFVVEYSGTEQNPPLGIPADVRTNPPANLEFGEDTTARRTSWSAFFQTTFRATDRLRLTAGARHNRDRFSADIGNFSGANFTGGSGPAPLAVTPQRTSGSTPTGKIAIDYDLTPATLVYASVTRGYKPGGVNANRTPVVVGKTFAPETVVSYEVGSKNRLLADTLRLNLAAFYYRYNNQQYLQVDPVPFNYGTSNIPKTEIWGGEAEASWLTLGRRLRLNATATLMGGKFSGDYKAIDAATAQQVYATDPACGFGGQFFNPACWAAVVAAAKSLDGNRPAKLPSLQGAVNAAYTAEVAQGLMLTRLEYVYRGGFQYRVFNDGRLDRVPSYGIWNLHLEYQPLGSRWTFSVTGSNLFDKAGVNSRFTDPYGRGVTSQEYIAPRQVVGTVAYAF